MLNPHCRRFATNHCTGAFCDDTVAAPLFGNVLQTSSLMTHQQGRSQMDQFYSALNEALNSDNFNVWPHIITLAAAYILALPIGFHREREERSAGLRTFPLVAVASCGFVQATEGVTTDNPEALARIIEGVITGMGFIGGGAILRLSTSVKGTATAASLWATGAIGIACAVNAFDVAIIIMVFALITLFLFSNGKAGAAQGEQDRAVVKSDKIV
jgi:putative Mg2+ transporter-C (MgtC) family protein